MHIVFRLVPTTMVSNDLDQRNSPYFVFFTEFDSFAGRSCHSGSHFAVDYFRISLICSKSTKLQLLEITSKHCSDAVCTRLLRVAGTITDVACSVSTSERGAVNTLTSRRLPAPAVLATNFSNAGRVFVLQKLWTVDVDIDISSRIISAASILICDISLCLNFRFKGRFYTLRQYISVISKRFCVQF